MDLDKLEEFARQHKAKINEQIRVHIKSGLTNGTITTADFEINADGDKMYRLLDQDRTEIIYNYTKSKVYSYGGNINNE